MPGFDGAALERAATCELQDELAKREGVRALRVGLRDHLTVLVNGKPVDERRGPLTVTVNWD